MDEDDHQGSQNSPVPKHPTPREVLDKERLPCLRHICREDDVCRIHCDPQQNIAHGKASQYEGKCQRVERARAEAGNNEQCDYGAERIAEWNEKTYRGKYPRASQKHATRAEKSSQKYGERANEHHRIVERGIDP